MDSALLTKVVAQEPRAVVQLLRLYGYDAEANVKNLANLLRVHGSKSLPISNFDDDEKKKTTLNDILDMVNKGVITLGNIINITKGKAIATNTNGVSTQLAPTPPNPERIFGINRNLFITLSIVMLALLTYKLLK